MKRLELKFIEPEVATFMIAVGLAVLGVLAFLGTISALSEYAFWLVVTGFILLALANLTKDL